MGKKIREDGPGSHLVKQGTPTMGGVLIVAVILARGFRLRRASMRPPTRPRGARARRRSRRGGRLPQRPHRHRHPGRQKLVWQTIVAIGVAIYVQNHFGFNGFRARSSAT
jgi:hypothetical protein